MSKTGMGTQHDRQSLSCDGCIRQKALGSPRRGGAAVGPHNHLAHQQLILKPCWQPASVLCKLKTKQTKTKHWRKEGTSRGQALRNPGPESRPEPQPSQLVLPRLILTIGKTEAWSLHAQEMGELRGNVVFPGPKAAVVPRVCPTETRVFKPDPS